MHHRILSTKRSSPWLGRTIFERFSIQKCKRCAMMCRQWATGNDSLGHASKWTFRFCSWRWILLCRLKANWKQILKLSLQKIHIACLIESKFCNRHCSECISLWFKEDCSMSLCCYDSKQSRLFGVSLLFRFKADSSAFLCCIALKQAVRHFFSVLLQSKLSFIFSVRSICLCRFRASRYVSVPTFRLRKIFVFQYIVIRRPSLSHRPWFRNDKFDLKQGKWCSIILRDSIFLRKGICSNLYVLNQMHSTLRCTPNSWLKLPFYVPSRSCGFCTICTLSSGCVIGI